MIFPLILGIPSTKSTFQFEVSFKHDSWCATCGHVNSIDSCMAQVTNVLMEKKHVFVGSVCFNKTKTGGLLNKPSWLVETTNQKKQILQFFTSVVETTHQQVGFFATNLVQTKKIKATSYPWPCHSKPPSSLQGCNVDWPILGAESSPPSITSLSTAWRLTAMVCLMSLSYKFMTKSNMNSWMHVSNLEIGQFKPKVWR